jgi:hypothetical protein
MASCPGTDCNDAKRNCFCLSLWIMNCTEWLQRLQTPSKKITGRLSVFVSTWHYFTGTCCFCIVIGAFIIFGFCAVSGLVLLKRSAFNIESTFTFISIFILRSRSLRDCSSDSLMRAMVIESICCLICCFVNGGGASLLHDAKNIPEATNTSNNFLISANAKLLQ